MPHLPVYLPHSALDLTHDTGAVQPTHSCIAAPTQRKNKIGLMLVMTPDIDMLEPGFASCPDLLIYPHSFCPLSLACSTQNSEAIITIPSLPVIGSQVTKAGP